MPRPLLWRRDSLAHVRPRCSRRARRLRGSVRPPAGGRPSSPRREAGAGVGAPPHDQFRERGLGSRTIARARGTPRAARRSTRGQRGDPGDGVGRESEAAQPRGVRRAREVRSHRGRSRTPSPRHPGADRARPRAPSVRERRGRARWSRCRRARERRPGRRARHGTRPPRRRSPATRRARPRDVGARRARSARVHTPREATTSASTFARRSRQRVQSWRSGAGSAARSGPGPEGSPPAAAVDGEHADPVPPTSAPTHQRSRWRVTTPRDHRDGSGSRQAWNVDDAGTSGERCGHRCALVGAGVHIRERFPRGHCAVDAVDCGIMPRAAISEFARAPPAALRRASSPAIRRPRLADGPRADGRRAHLARLRGARARSWPRRHRRRLQPPAAGHRRLLPRPPAHPVVGGVPVVPRHRDQRGHHHLGARHRLQRELAVRPVLRRLEPGQVRGRAALHPRLLPLQLHDHLRVPPATASARRAR